MEKDLISILAVDTRKDHAPLLEAFSSSDLPSRLTFADSTAEAIRLMSQTSFDLVTTDHKLPDINAFQILAEARTLCPQAAVVFLTEDATMKSTRDAFQKGMDDVLLKMELGTLPLLDVIGNCIEKRRLREAQEEAGLRLRELAERDGLTGLFNQRYLLEALEREFLRARRYHRPLSVLILDLDEFKQINDTCGHIQGDAVIRQVGHLLLQTVRFVDIAARYGGDEFVLVLPETHLKEAQALANRLLKEIRAHPFVYEGKSYPLSASIGVSAHNMAQTSAASLLKEADEALYQSKKSGRSRVSVSGLISLRRTPPKAAA